MKTLKTLKNIRIDKSTAQCFLHKTEKHSTEYIRIVLQTMKY